MIIASVSTLLTSTLGKLLIYHWQTAWLLIQWDLRTLERILVVDDTFEEMPFTVGEIEEEVGGKTRAIGSRSLMFFSSDHRVIKWRKPCQRDKWSLSILIGWGGPQQQESYVRILDNQQWPYVRPEIRQPNEFPCGEAAQILESTKTSRSRITAWPGYSKWPITGFVGIMWPTYISRCSDEVIQISWDNTFWCGSKYVSIKDVQI